MSLNAINFDNPAVTNAINPSTLGWAHGPIPNNNAGYVDPARAAAIAANTRPLPAVSAALNAAAPVPGEVLNPCNTGVCDIAVNGNQMCGQVFVGAPARLRHVRNEHTGALINPSRTNITPAQRIAGENSMKLWVRSGGWRDADYLHEPGVGPVNGYMNVYATACERIARQDPAFAQAFGTHFHRRPENRPPPSSGKRKRGPSPPPFDDDDNDPPSPTPTTKKKRNPKKKSAGPGSRASARVATAVSSEA